MRGFSCSAISPGLLPRGCRGNLSVDYKIRSRRLGLLVFNAENEESQLFKLQTRRPYRATNWGLRLDCNLTGTQVRNLRLDFSFFQLVKFQSTLFLSLKIIIHAVGDTRLRIGLEKYQVTVN